MSENKYTVKFSEDGTWGVLSPENSTFPNTPFAWFSTEGQANEYCHRINTPLSEALEESYKNGFNDGQVEGLPGDCIKCLKEDKTTMLEHDAKVAKAESDISKDLFEMLDNIDTASDIAKGDDKLYRSLISQEHTKRFKYANPDGSYRGIESQRSEP